MSDAQQQQPESPKTGNDLQTADSGPFVGFDAVKRRALEAVATGGLYEEAAQAAGVTRQTLYNWRQADPAFAAAWKIALDAGTDEIEAVLHACTKLAKGDPRYQTSLIFALENRRPESWKDVWDHRLSGQVGILAQVAGMDEATLRRLAHATDDDPEITP